MVFSTLLRALRTKYLKPDLPEDETADLVTPPSKPTHYNLTTLSNSIKYNRFTSNHKLHDPRIGFTPKLEEVSWKGPWMDGATLMLDLNALSTPVNKPFPRDPASIEEEVEKEKKATDNIFYVHAELVETASVLFFRQIVSGDSSIAVPGEDRDVIQLFARFLYSNNIHSNLVDAYAVTGGCGTLSFKLRDDSYVHLNMPDDEEKLLVKAYLFGYSYSCWMFCDAVIDTLICKIIDQKRVPVLHGLLDLDSSDARFYPLKMLIAHLAIYTWTDAQLRGFALAHKFDTIDHVKFWADVGGYNAMHKSSIFGLPNAPWKKDPCHYHVHSLYPKMKYDCYILCREIAQSSASDELDDDSESDD